MGMNVLVGNKLGFTELEWVCVCVCGGVGDLETAGCNVEVGSAAVSVCLCADTFCAVLCCSELFCADV